MAKASWKREMTAALERVHDEGQGVWEIEVVPMAALPEIATEAMMGNRRAIQLANVFVEVAKRICCPPEDEIRPMLCMTCNTAFTATNIPPRSIVVVCGANPSSLQHIVSALCTDCDISVKRQDRIMNAIRRYYCSDARVIDVGEPGHA